MARWFDSIRSHRFGAWAAAQKVRARRRRDSPSEILAAVRRLAHWPKPLPLDSQGLIRESLERSAIVFRASRALMAWEEPDEPFLHLALFAGGEVRLLETEAGSYEPLYDERLGDFPFLCNELSADKQDVSYLSSSGEQRLAGCPIHPLLAKDLQISSLLSFDLDGDTIQGRLFLLDLPWVSSELFPVGQVAAAMIVSRMDQGSLRRAGRQALEERLRVARDLHDGLLQSLTGLVLQLETLHEILEKDPQRARGLVTQLESVIMSDQRELRSYVDLLRPRTARVAPEFDFIARLTELRDRFDREWGLALTFEMKSMDPLVSRSLGQETYKLISEAVMNSAKHGASTEVKVELQTREGEMLIIVSDNGNGFPFRGRYDLAALSEQRVGPAILAERVASLNGQLIIESSETGARLEIYLPLGWKEGE